MPAALRGTERDRDGRGWGRERGPRRRRHRRLQELQVRAGARLTPLEGRPQGSEGNHNMRGLLNWMFTQGGKRSLKH